MSESAPDALKLLELKRALDSDVRSVLIRLREGEYQFSLAKAIASFEFGLCFPDVKDLVRKLYGEKSVEDQQFLNKIQTILKKMEKSGVIKILPKEKPWELQRYALTSFKFLDVERNPVSFATSDEIEKTRQAIDSQPKPESVVSRRPKNTYLQLLPMIAIIAVSLSVTIWALTQSPINLALFTAAFSLAALSSVVLGLLAVRSIDDLRES